MKIFVFVFLCFCFLNYGKAQDTFSILAFDSITREVGAAGASCVDLIQYFPNYPDDFICELFSDTGAIACQASYLPANQINARNRMRAGDTPTAIISWLQNNDVAANSAIRQYGVVKMVYQGETASAAHTGSNCFSYKNHITGVHYSIQGNILLGQQVLDSMESRFKRASGDLACKLMAALQGAKIPGADTRCMANQSSSLFAFLKVAQPTDPFGNPSLRVSVRTQNNQFIEPIDSLQQLFNRVHSCIPSTLELPNTSFSEFKIFPNPSTSYFEIQSRLPVFTAECVLTDALGIDREHLFVSESRVAFGKSINPGLYFLKVIINNTEIKVFKLLKN